MAESFQTIIKYLGQPHAGPFKLFIDDGYCWRLVGVGQCAGVLQFAVNSEYRHSMRFICPRNRIAMRPFVDLGRCNVSRKLHGVATLIAFHRWLNNAAIPDGVQVHLTAHKCHLHLVAATIMIVRSVERLMDVSNEMDQVFEGFQSLAT